jgi:hypothetical protein
VPASDLKKPTPRKSKHVLVYASGSTFACSVHVHFDSGFAVCQCCLQKIYSLSIRFRCRPGRSPSLSKRRRSALGALFWTGIPLVLGSPHDAFDAGRRSAHRPSRLDSHPHRVCSPLASRVHTCRHLKLLVARHSFAGRSSSSALVIAAGRSRSSACRRSRSSTLAAGCCMFYRKEKKNKLINLLVATACSIEKKDFY